MQFQPYFCRNFIEFCINPTLKFITTGLPWVGTATTRAGTIRNTWECLGVTCLDPDPIFSLYRDFRRICISLIEARGISIADAKFLLPLEPKLQNLSIPPRNRPETEYRPLASSAPAPSSPSKSEIFRIWRERYMQEIRHGAGWALWGKAPAGATSPQCPRNMPGPSSGPGGVWDASRPSTGSRTKKNIP